MRNQGTSFAAAAAALLLATGVGPAAAREPVEPAAQVDVWDGYVWNDGQGRLQLGRGVIAMGVMARPDFVIEGPLAAKLAPYAVATSEYVFWNYMLERPESEMFQGLPRVLVRLEGRVEIGEDPSPGSFPSQRPRTMKDARLTAIEFLSEGWLKDWAHYFRRPESPFRVARKPEVTPEQERAFAVQSLRVLEAMRKHAGPTEAQLAEARALDPAARVTQRFREGEEDDIQRWLVAADKEKGWNLEGLAALPALPPTSTEIQGWFLAAETKATFLAKVKEAWKGHLDRLVLVHYVQHENSTTYATADLQEVSERWSEADVQRAKKVTASMVASR
jgi:hypothetical protein